MHGNNDDYKTMNKESVQNNRKLDNNQKKVDTKKLILIVTTNYTIVFDLSYSPPLESNQFILLVPFDRGWW